MKSSVFNDELLTFLSESPTQFHAVQNMTELLKKAGYQSLEEADEWQVRNGGRYYVVRNGSSLVAFNLASKEAAATQGVRMMGAHTDSPCLKVKPNPELFQKGYFQLGVEVYGGVLLNPWFDRDLSLAGRVTFQDKSGTLSSALVNFIKPVAMIPSLAIHLDRDVNNNRSVNAQRDLPPILMQVNGDEMINMRAILCEQLKSEYPSVDVAKILDYELALYDTQPAALVGLQQEFIASARLDNLLSCFIGLKALLSSDATQNALLVCNDHEEVGSLSAEGAQGPFLLSVLERLWPDPEFRTRVLRKSFMLSMDNAHGVHPNFADRHDGNHGPVLNQGPVIKINSNQRYATNSESSSLFRWLCEKVAVPCQSFVVRSDMACGSTIGPITAGGIGVTTIDVGVPQFAMHSIRELAGSRDAFALYQVATALCDCERVIV
ncbi:MAG: M18 family aminopeptidase [Hahellaceae bacterium]|nr:M18 family aminopeptidase [Hahellaceae bacterium]